MRRKIIPGSDPGIITAAVTTPISEFLSTPKAPRAPRGTYRNELDVAVADAAARARSGHWADAKPPALVGLYTYCHTRIYGVEPIELRQSMQFRQACKMVTALFAEVGDDRNQIADMVKWTWDREKRGLAAARAKREERDFRVSWRYQFGIKMLTNYRVFIAQHRSRR